MSTNARTHPMAASANRSRRRAALAVGCVGLLGVIAGPAPSEAGRAAAAAAKIEAEPAAQLHAVTAGPGTIGISPSEAGSDAICATDFFASPGSEPCTQRYATGARVTLTAAPSDGASFVGWSDYRCRDASPTCTLTMEGGEQYVTARFSPVRIVVQSGDFGAVSVSPSPGAQCALTETSPQCIASYRPGTLVTLRRANAAPGKFWLGPCEGNTEGRLDADVCRIRLQGDELVKAGGDNLGEIPPTVGSGLRITLGGNRRGTVTGRVLNGAGRLNCGSLCVLSRLSHGDAISLTARARPGSRFVGWSDNVRGRSRPRQLPGRLKATFARKRR